MTTNHEVDLTIKIDSELKNALMLFCRKKGMSIDHLIEDALIEKLEDEIDIQFFDRRSEEGVVPFEAIIEQD